MKFVDTSKRSYVYSLYVPDTNSDIFSMKRRGLLATMASSTVAGCNSTDSSNSPTFDANQDDCIEETEYNHLKREYETLKNDYNELVNKFEYAQLPPYIVSSRRSISVTYETLDEEIDSWKWDSSTLMSQFTTGFFTRELTYDQLEYLGLNERGFKNNSKFIQLEGFGYYYQLNPFVIPSNFTPLAEKLHNRYESDLKRIRAAWNFVTQLNDYVAEIRESPRFPLETLLLGGGDCEDSAILLGSLIYAMPRNYNVSFWFIDIDHPTDPENINHVVLGVDVDDTQGFIETTSDTMSPWNKISGFSVPIEPTES